MAATHLVQQPHVDLADARHRDRHGTGDRENEAPSSTGPHSSLSLSPTGMAMQQELLRWALRYAEQGLPVFPVGGNKIPLVKWRESGGSTDPAQISAWWRRWPLAMIAMPTGWRSGLIVLDVDRKNGVDGLPIPMMCPLPRMMRSRAMAICGNSASIA